MATQADCEKCRGQKMEEGKATYHCVVNEGATFLPLVCGIHNVQSKVKESLEDSEETQ